MLPFRTPAAGRRVRQRREAPAPAPASSAGESTVLSLAIAAGDEDEDEDGDAPDAADVRRPVRPPLALRSALRAAGQHLQPGEPLGEDLVDAYARCLREWFPAPGGEAAGGYDIAPTLLFRSMCDTGRAPRSLGDRLRSHRVCFVPALHRGHWRLVVLVPAARRLYVADSLGQPPGLPRPFWEALRGVAGGAYVPVGGPGAVQALRCPAQGGGPNNDCGVHALQNLEALFVMRRLLP